MSECPDGYRICKTCGECKPETAEFFRTDSQNPQWLRRQCRDCANEQKARKRHGDKYEERLEKVRIKEEMKTKGLKECSRCKKVFPATPEYFYPRRNRRSGLTSLCKECDGRRVSQLLEANPEKRKLKNERLKQTRKDNPEKTRAQARAYRTKNPEKHKESTRRWRKKDPEWYRQYVNAQTAAWRRKNIERAREMSRRLTREHPERVKAAHAKRNAAKQTNGANDFSASDWTRALQYFDHRCAICGRVADEFVTIVPDHWNPLKRGGANTATNIVPLCHSKPGGHGGCNSSKQGKHPNDWLQYKYGDEKAQEHLARIEAYFEWVRGQ